MNILGFPYLSLILFFPMAGAFLLAFIPKKDTLIIKLFTLVWIIVEFLISVPLYFLFNSHTYSMQFVENYSWIKSLNIHYFLGIDGISLFLVLLTTFLMISAQWSTWEAVDKKVKEFNIALLLLETGMLGVFLALDGFLFYVFWEFELIPMYLLIGIWGGKFRVYATMKFFLYTFAGSVLMLVAIMALYFIHGHITGDYTFNLVELAKAPLPLKWQFWLFLAFFIAFAIKVPIWPFHTWLPWAHVEAPTAGSVLLAGVLLKMGTYGFLRFNLPMFPDMTRMFVPVIAAVALIGVYYGAWVAMVQPDMKKLVAYSSVSHLGYVMLGMFALNRIGMEGSILQMINHGISTGALFLIVGVIYERTHTRLIGRYSGLAAIMPAYAAMAGIFIFSSIGLPGMNGFIGEILILVGVFKSNIWYGMLLAPGAIFSATYMLVMYRRVFFHKPKPELVELSKQGKLKDLSLREFSYFIPIVLLVFWIGLYPNAFLSKMHTSVNHLITQVHREVPANKNISMLTGGKR
ncbi:MAG: NADH-quinone oxidoreductase subunit M [bacterium]|nr:MAG: NADH-quinone oxidoreductase subunit M [bacterium]